MVFPARAGMIPISDVVVAYRRGIPRESGDDPDTFFADIAHELYSPRERG